MGNECERNDNQSEAIRQHYRVSDLLFVHTGIWILGQIARFTKITGTPGDINKFVMIVVITISTTSQLFAQAHMDYAVQANIVYRFTKYVDWPQSKKNGNFVIGIVGDSPLYDQLKSFISNKRVGHQKIVIRKFSTSETIYNCHILFISEEKSNSVKKIAALTKGSSTLLVTESDGLARKGSCINFILVEDHLKLEINKLNIEERDLSIATELVSLGILIK